MHRLVELTRINPVQENVLVGLSSKQPKAVTGSVIALKEAIRQVSSCCQEVVY